MSKPEIKIKDVLICRKCKEPLRYNVTGSQVIMLDADFRFDEKNLVLVPNGTAATPDGGIKNIEVITRCHCGTNKADVTEDASLITDLIEAHIDKLDEVTSDISNIDLEDEFTFTPDGVIDKLEATRTILTTFFEAQIRLFGDLSVEHSQKIRKDYDTGMQLLNDVLILIEEKESADGTT